MLIGEVVAKIGLTKDTIRFYEKKGLIKVERSDSQWNNYKNYSSEVVGQLIFIQKAKGFGFTLNEIAELFDLIQINKASCKVLSDKMGDKLKEIDKKIAKLKSLKTMILNKAGFANINCGTNKQQSNCETLKIKKTT